MIGFNKLALGKKKTSWFSPPLRHQSLSSVFGGYSVEQSTWSLPQGTEGYIKALGTFLVGAEDTASNGSYGSGLEAGVAL